MISSNFTLPQIPPRRRFHPAPVSMGMQIPLPPRLEVLPDRPPCRFCVPPEPGRSLTPLWCAARPDLTLLPDSPPPRNKCVHTHWVFVYFLGANARFICVQVQKKTGACVQDHLPPISMPKFHVFRATCQQKQVSHISHT